MLSYLTNEFIYYVECVDRHLIEMRPSFLSLDIFPKRQTSCKKDTMFTPVPTFADIKKVFFALISVLLMIGAGVLPAKANTTDIIGLRTGAVSIDGLTNGKTSATRVVIETSSRVDVSMLLLANPYRLVLDLPRSEWKVAGRPVSGKLGAAALKGYRLGSPKPDVTRLVFDLNGPQAPVRAFRLEANDRGHRFVVDLLDRGDTAFKLASSALLKNRDKPLNLGVSKTKPNEEVMLLPQRRPQNYWPAKDRNGMLLPQPRPETVASAQDVDRVVDDLTTIIPKSVKAPSYAERNSKWVVFIDAGHGGKDPGAIGVSGQREKDITLRAAIELARQLNATGKVKAVLSRDRDIYHKLRTRINLARKAKADVFISLHADAAHNHKAHGVSVFTLSDKASDKEAARLASRENKADLIGGPDLDTTDQEVTTALLGMFQRESMNQSSILAAEMNNSFEGLSTAKRGHRFAGFAVLKSPDIPSVLVEMGFLTNKSDEKKLKSKAYIRDLMARITRSVIRYLERNA